MNYQIQFSRPAQKQLKQLTPELQQRIAQKLTELAQNPRQPGSEKLKGQEEVYRIRVGQYRILYEIQDQQLIVLVIKIGHRRDVYRR